MTHQTDYQKIVFDSEKSILEVFWQNTDSLRDQQYRQELLWQLAIILQYCPKNMLFDTHIFDFVITPDTQDWSNTEILPKVMQSGVQKIALVVSSDLFSQVSIEQQIEDNPKVLSLLRYFDDYKSAKEWLMV